MDSQPRGARKKTSNWRSVRMPNRQGVVSTLKRRYSLRLHGFLIGSFILLLMWCASHVQMLLGVDSLALRYFLTLSVGYLGYLLVLRAWAERLVRSEKPSQGDAADVHVDLPAPGSNSSGGSGQMPLPRSGGGGDFAGGGASGDLGGGWMSALSDVGSSAGSAGDAASGAADALGSLDEGAVVVVPVVAIFLIGAAVIFGAGALAMLFFGWDALLAVAVELAFSVATARVAMGVEREGWLSAAVRLTWKPLLGALFFAVALGATIDYFAPEAKSLPQVVRAITG